MSDISNREISIKKARQYTFHGAYLHDANKSSRFIARLIKIRVVKNKGEEKIESLHIQAAFDYEAAKRLSQLKIFSKIELPPEKENIRLYCYFNSNEYLRSKIRHSKKRYPYMTLAEVFLDGESETSFYFNEISYYNLLDWKVEEI